MRTRTYSRADAFGSDHCRCRPDHAARPGRRRCPDDAARPGRRRCPDDAAFTMIELVVSVGLMIILLGVLAFVFRGSAEAVASSTEAVNTVQRARSFEAKFGQDVSRAVRTVLETETGRTARTFMLAPDLSGGSQININPDGGDTIMFVSKTRYKGIEDMWVIRYYYEEIGDTGYGSIKRMVRIDSQKEESSGDIVPYNVADPSIWDIGDSEPYSWSEEDSDLEVEMVCSPVRPLEDTPIFFAIDPDASLVGAGLAFRLPASVKVSLNFLDSRGATSFQLPTQFNFPIYQGE
jgi:type II secretory pathway pseudopilin PulG